MFSVKDYVQPAGLDEAYQLLTAKRNNRIVSGGAFLRLGRKRINTAVDLSGLGLDFIREEDGRLEIGAMTTLRELETSPLVNPAVRDAVSNIIGVQLRNLVTVGGSVFARYGFSDLIPALLALHTEVELYQAGRLPLADFLTSPRQKDILLKIIINGNDRAAAYQCMRKATSDFPLLAVAVSKGKTDWMVAVGARPGKALIASGASAALAGENPEGAGKIAAEELVFGSNAMASAAYRRTICRALVDRVAAEVRLCK